MGTRGLDSEVIAGLQAEVPSNLVNQVAKK
jgi:hypothetical protein